MNGLINVVYPYNRILFCYKREWNTDTYYNMNNPWKHNKWRSQPQKATHSMIPFIWKSRVDKSKEPEIRFVSDHLGLGGRCEGKGMTGKGYGVSWWDDENVLK